MEYPADRANRAVLIGTLVTGGLLAGACWYVVVRRSHTAWLDNGSLRRLLDSIQDSEFTAVYLSPYFWALTRGHSCT